jgi:hypothetical protein
LARNLIAQMLTKDPARRPLMNQVLAHPFFTGRHTARLVGMAPEVRCVYFLSSGQ